MAIDIRANVTCSLGTLISASISDDYVQGNGLIKTQGSCEIKGLIGPPQGSVVTFSYTKSGITRAIPRKLRVLSSFADPYRRTTKVELGCKLTYLQDLKDPIKWNALDDPENEDINEAESRIVTFPIYAASIMNRCLFALGLTASVNPLTNRFSIPEFDFGSGYVQTLSDLLVSESFCGYLDYTEKLQIFSLAAPSAPGPAFGEGNIIDIGPIGVGDLAGDAVTVSYSTLKLRIPDDTEVAEKPGDDPEEQPTPTVPGTGTGWGTDTATTSSRSTIGIAYTDPGGNSKFASYTISANSTEQTSYTKKIFKGGNKYVVTQRQINEERSLVEVMGSAASAYLSAGSSFGNSQISSTTIESFQYDLYGNEVFRELVKRGDAAFLAGSASIPWTFPNEDGTTFFVEIPGGTVTLERVTVNTYINGNYRKIVTRRYGPWIYSAAGQQAIAESRDAISTPESAIDILNGIYAGTVLLDVTINTLRSAPGAGSQEAPPPEDINDEGLADPDTSDPDNGFRTESVSEIELATGSPTATRRIELSMPYAPDDSFYRSIKSLDPLTYSYRSSSSNAPAKAKLFGITQNRLLFGNRNGMNIQTVPENLPNDPFGAFYLTANGVVTQYRTNGTSWTMDSNGVVASTDALYWGIVGKTS
jgi:hypothetical protein